MDEARLQHVLRDLEEELRDAEVHVSDVRAALLAVQKLVGQQAATLPLPLTTLPSKEGKARPRMGDAVVIVMHEGGNRGVSLNGMCDELLGRGWVGVTKDGKPSKPTVRAVLLALQKEGITQSRKPSDSPWSESTWFLTERGMERGAALRRAA